MNDESVPNYETLLSQIKSVVKTVAAHEEMPCHGSPSCPLLDAGGGTRWITDACIME